MYWLRQFVKFTPTELDAIKPRAQEAPSDEVEARLLEERRLLHLSGKNWVSVSVDI